MFLSCKGEGTHLKFIGHLYAALCLKGIFYTFKDDVELNKGKDIGPELMNTIEDLQCAVVVLFENYATSTWCLREVSKIVKCVRDSGQIRTIFNHINPSQGWNMISIDLKKQKESSFWKAWEQHVTA